MITLLSSGSAGAVLISARAHPNKTFELRPKLFLADQLPRSLGRLQLETDEGRRYMYNRSSPPYEVSTDPRAVDLQVGLIEDAHRRGGEVLASSHALVRLTPEGALHIGRLAEERGADAVKIVQFCANYEDVVEALSEPLPVRAAMGPGWERIAEGMVETESGPLLVVDVAALIGGIEAKAA